MNMKKTFAGVMASVVAISAMATMGLSAKNDLTFTEDQAAKNKVWDFTGKSYPITWKGSAVANGEISMAAATDQGSVLNFVTDVDVDELSVTIAGKATGASTTTISRTFAAKKGSDAKHWSLTYNTVASLDVGEFNLKEIAESTAVAGKYDISSITLNYTLGSSEKTKADADDAAKAAKTVKATMVADAGSGTGTTLVSDIIAVLDNDTTANTVCEVKAAKGSVGSADTTRGITLTGFAADAAKNSAGNWIGSITSQEVIYYLDAHRDWNDDEVDDVEYYKEAVNFSNITPKSTKKAAVAEAAAHADNGSKTNTYVGLNNLLKAIQNEIGDARGATISFGIYEATKDTGDKTGDVIGGGSDAPIKSAASAEDFAFAVNTSSSANFYTAADMKDGKIVLKWDDITKGLAAGTINDGAIRIKAGASFTIDSITLDVPAKSLSDLTLGEGVEETEAPSVTDAATEAPAATEAAPNPTTGNAPIALAVIPVAIVAAAIVAKKRG